MDKKICTWCKKEKDLNEFVLQTKKRDGRASNCKSCMKEKREQMKAVRNKKRNDKRANDINYRITIIERDKKWRQNNIEHVKQRYNRDKEGCLRRSKKWREENKETVLIYQKKYDQIKKQNFKNQFADVIEFQEAWKILQKEFYRINLNLQYKEKRKTDIQYKLKDNLRARTRKILRIQSANKYTSMANLIGCSGKQLADYFLEKGYNPDTDTIDHYVPIGRFDLTIPEHQLVSCHYLNLQPLDSKINYAKSDMLVNGWEEKIYQICEVRNINPQPIINHIKETAKC